MIDLPWVLLIVGVVFTVGWFMGFITGRWTKG